MKLDDIKTLVKSIPIILAVALYLIFAPDKDADKDAPTTPDKTTQQTSNDSTQNYEITPNYAELQTGNKLYEVDFVKANDGDTFSVKVDGKTERVRLLMVDTPEMNYKENNPQPYAEEAKDFTINILENAKKIELLHDVGDKADHYDRLLAYVFVDGVLLQERLLEEGYAAVRFIYKPNNTLEDDFYHIQQKAEQAKSNIWEHEGYFTKQGFDDAAISE